MKCAQTTNISFYTATYEFHILTAKNKGGAHWWKTNTISNCVTVKNSWIREISALRTDHWDCRDLQSREKHVAQFLLCSELKGRKNRLLHKYCNLISHKLKNFKASQFLNLLFYQINYDTVDLVKRFLKSRRIQWFINFQTIFLNGD